MKYFCHWHVSVWGPSINWLWHNNRNTGHRCSLFLKRFHSLHFKECFNVCFPIPASAPYLDGGPQTPEVCLNSLDLAGIRETRASVWTLAAWLPLPDWPQRMSSLSDSLSLIWAETGEGGSELKNSDLASAAWVQSHLWRDAEVVSRCFTIINKASRT